MVAYLLVTCGVLAWLGSGQKKRRAAKKGAASRNGDGDDPVDDMGEIGTAGGFLGGELDDLFVGRFALRRAKIARREPSSQDREPKA